MINITRIFVILFVRINPIGFQYIAQEYVSSFLYNANVISLGNFSSGSPWPTLVLVAKKKQSIFIFR